MEILKRWRLAVAVLLGALTAGTFIITGYLSRLETGVNQNLRAGQALLEAQKAIRDHNALLADMVVVTNRIGDGLDGLLVRSEAIQSQVKDVSEANRAILGLNGAVEGNNADSARDLNRIVSALRHMNQSAAAIRDYMVDLRDTAASDVDLLRAMGANTARMNARTPGW